MPTVPHAFVSPEEYLELDHRAEYRSEYYDGEMFAMAGAGEAHNQIVANLVRDLGNQIEGGACRVSSNDMRVRVGATAYTYPDLVMVCGERRFANDRRETLLNPLLIVEVLSPSTEAHDRGRKFQRYRAIDSLREHLLVDSQSETVDLYRRQPDGTWNLAAPADAIELKSVNCRLQRSRIYRDVEFASPPSSTAPHPSA